MYDLLIRFIQSMDEDAVDQDPDSGGLVRLEPPPPGYAGEPTKVRDHHLKAILQLPYQDMKIVLENIMDGDAVPRMVRGHPSACIVYVYHERNPRHLQYMRTHSSIQSADHVGIVKPEAYFSVVKSYVDKYHKLRTLQWWQWKAKRDMRKMRISEEEVHAKLRERQKVLLSSVR